MKTDIAGAIVLWVMALFGLRGVLPDIIQSGEGYLFLGLSVAGILSYAVGNYAKKCEPACTPELCRM